VARALCPAGDTEPEKPEPSSPSAVARSRLSVQSELPPSIRMSPGQEGDQCGDLVGDRRACGNHHQDHSWAGEGVDERSSSVSVGTIRSRRAPGLFVEGARLVRAPVVDGDPVTGLRDVERQVGAHGAKADQADGGLVQT
jgi:hypothetical protein